MGTRLSFALAAPLVACAAQAADAPAAAPAAEGKVAAPHVYGQVEHAQVRVSPAIEIQAQLTGGGDVTTLAVNDIKYASGEGGVFVHFTIDNGYVMTGRTVSVALPVLKDQHLKDRNGGVEHRPIVSMSFCIGDHAFTTTVVLINRENFTPPLLLGKADAAQFGAIDPLKKNTGDPNCAPATPPPAATAQ